LEVLTNTRQVDERLDAVLRQQLLRANSRELENLRAAWSASGQDYLTTSLDAGRTVAAGGIARYKLWVNGSATFHPSLTAECAYVDRSSDLVLVEIDLADRLSSDEVEVASLAGDGSVVAIRRTRSGLVHSLE